MWSAAEHEIVSTSWLGRDEQSLMQEFWRKIGPVAPDDSVKFRVDLERAELSRILEGGKDFAMELVSEVDKPLCAIVEFEPQDIVPFMFRVDNV